MGKKGNKRKTRWRVLPIGGDDADCLYSTNEDDGEADLAATSPTATNGPGSYARAAQPGRGKPGSKPRPSGYQPAYYRPHRSMPESRQPLVTAEKKTFNEEEYTKITTPRQDVLFKKGYLGRKKTVTSTTAAAGAVADATAATAAAVTGAALTATNCIELAPMHNGGDCEQLGEQAEVLSPADEQPQYIYPNGYVDGVIYVNGAYEWYDPYGNVTVVVGPAPPFAGPGGGASMLAALPCQPLPLQPIEWFNPAYGVPYVPAPTLPSCPRERDRRKRCSADSQNCSPQSSESTDPPGSPQEGEGEVECEGDGEVDDGMLPALPGMMNGTDEYAMYPHGHPVQPHQPPQPQAYMYPGAYMFGQPIYSMNGITVQSTSQLPQNTDNSGSKRRKKKRRRRRRRGGVDDGSEETSSDEKDLEEPVSLTSQESSQEVESDSKNSAGSASCPTIVGCPELPERTPESPSSSPSLSPSLSPSPSLSNATEDKTALPKVNYVNTNAQQENSNVRSEGGTENAETLVLKTSSQKVENNSLQSYIPNIEKSDGIQTLNETNLQTPIITQNGETNADPVLVIDASKTNGNYSINDGKSFELDNNLSATDRYTVHGESEIVNSIGLSNDCVIKNNVSKQKSKGKKGLKLHKQKLPVHNGFSEQQVNEHSSKSQGTYIEMDGNERGELTKDKSPPSGNQPQFIPKQHDTKCESETASESPLDLDDPSKCKVKPSLALSSIEVPKKPARAHQHRQQQKSQLSGEESSSQQKDESVNLSSVSFGGQLTNEETNPQEKITLAQSDQETKDDISVSVVSMPKLKLADKPMEQKDSATTLSTECEINEKEKSFRKELEKQIQCTVIEPKRSKEWGEEGDSECSKERSELSEGSTSDSQREESKITGELQSTNKFCISEIQKSIGSCDAHENNKSDIQKSLPNVPEWATSSPPIPPPRRKKWQPKSSTERPPTPGRELEAKKQREIPDDSSSSSSRESEDSVIDLLSSSPTEKLKDVLEHVHDIGFVKSDDILTSKISTSEAQLGRTQNSQILNQDHIDKGKLSPGKEEVREKDLHASKPDEFTTCISKNSQQILTRDQSQDKYSEFKSELHSEGKIVSVDTNTVSEERTDNAAKVYADDLANQVLDASISKAATTMNKTLQTQSLSLTEAVTQWLHCQDVEEVLQLPQILESESDIEDAEETSEEEIQMTGPKNVYRNPLLAPSCEAENICDDASIRVANLDKNNTLNPSVNSILPDSVTKDNSTKELENQFLNENLEINNKAIHVKLTCEHVSNYSIMQNRGGDAKCEESGMNNGRRKTKGLNLEEWDCFIDESAEYDADWECDPVVLKSACQVLPKEDQESNLSLEANEKCSYMCDPTLSVAKYYRLGPSSERDVNNKDMLCDFDSGRDDDDDDDGNDEDFEGLDALVHFKNELEGHSCQSQGGHTSYSQLYHLSDIEKNGRRNKTVSGWNSFKKREENYDSSNDGFTSDSGIQSEESCNEFGHRASTNSSKSFSDMNSILKRKSAIILSHLGAEGPFPCGGICCILQ